MVLSVIGLFDAWASLCTEASNLALNSARKTLALSTTTLAQRIRKIPFGQRVGEGATATLMNMADMQIALTGSLSVIERGAPLREPAAAVPAPGLHRE